MLSTPITEIPQGPRKTMSTEEASLSVGRSVLDGMLEIHSVIPDGVTIGTGTYGRCLIANKHFPKGSLMYRAYAALVPMEECPGKAVANPSSSSDESEDPSLTETSVSSSSAKATEYVLHVYNEKDGKPIESFILDDLNSVEDFVNPSENRRQVYGFDGFMNHSCSPNCYCPLSYRTPDLMCYNTIAEKDIHPGDEITCDYALFDYECDGHEIAECGCKSPSCRGQMLGFKYLSLDEKVRVMHQCEKEIVEKFFDENPNVILLRSDLPEGVSLKHASDSTPLVASREFKAGEVVYTNQAVLLPSEEFHGNTYIVEIDNRYMRLDPDEHFIHRPEYVEYLGFDSFQDHSCDPNTSQLYTDSTTYTVRATRTIKVGELLTIDYGRLENQADNIEHIASSKFECKCGSTKCRKVIVA